MKRVISDDDEDTIVFKRIRRPSTEEDAKKFDSLQMMKIDVEDKNMSEDEDKNELCMWCNHLHCSGLSDHSTERGSEEEAISDARPGLNDSQSNSSDKEDPTNSSDKEDIPSDNSFEKEQKIDSFDEEDDNNNKYGLDFYFDDRLDHIQNSYLDNPSNNTENEYSNSEEEEEEEEEQSEEKDEENSEEYEDEYCSSDNEGQEVNGYSESERGDTESDEDYIAMNPICPYCRRRHR